METRYVALSLATHLAGRKTAAKASVSKAAVLESLALGLTKLGMAIVAVLALGACQPDRTAEDLPASGARDGAGAAAARTAEERVAHGEYLVNVLGCNDCHTPWHMTDTGPAPDMSRMLSGHPQDLQMPPAPEVPLPWLWVGGATNTVYSGPWGVTFSPNLTSNEETGIGAWDEALFIASIRNGKIRGAGRPILPPMPIQAYENLTDEDLGAVFAYLQTIPAIHNQVPEWIPPAGGAPAGGH